jgi:hypothetical protein
MVRQADRAVQQFSFAAPLSDLATAARHSYGSTIAELTIPGNCGNVAVTYGLSVGRANAQPRDVTDHGEFVPLRDDERSTPQTATAPNYSLAQGHARALVQAAGHAGRGRTAPASGAQHVQAAAGGDAV